MLNKKHYTTGLFFSVLLLTTTAVAVPANEKLIKVDGSSTVYPITEAVAEEFGAANPGARVTVGVSGTGGGFKKFCSGETHISNGSRPIKKDEAEICEKNQISYIELPVAYDALSVVVNPKNTWVDKLTTAELKMMWDSSAQKKIVRWNQIRAEWPNEEIALFGPGTDSGTYDYFIEAILGKDRSTRGDYTSSEDDNVLVQGVSSNKNALGFFGLAYYMENKDKLRAVPIDNMKQAGAQLPTVENVIAGKYQPLSRPLFIYVSKTALESQNVKEFISFYLKNASKLATEVGYVQLPAEASALAAKRFESQTLGSLYLEGAKPGLSVVDVMRGSKNN